MARLILKIIEDINGTLIFSVDNRVHIKGGEAVRIMQALMKKYRLAPTK